MVLIYEIIKFWYGDIILILSFLGFAVYLALIGMCVTERTEDLSNAKRWVGMNWDPPAYSPDADSLAFSDILSNMFGFNKRDSWMFDNPMWAHKRSPMFAGLYAKRAPVQYPIDLSDYLDEDINLW